MKVSIILLALMSLAGCRNTGNTIRAAYSKQEDKLIRVARISGTDIQITYLPLCWERVLNRTNADAEKELTFKISMSWQKTAGMQDRSPQEMAGTAAAFQLVVNSDTITPLFAQQVANGQQHGAVYLVVFNRAAMKAATGIQFLFSDPLYTHHRLSFPFDVKEIQKY